MAVGGTISTFDIWESTVTASCAIIVLYLVVRHLLKSPSLLLRSRSVRRFRKFTPHSGFPLPSCSWSWRGYCAGGWSEMRSPVERGESRSIQAAYGNQGTWPVLAEISFLETWHNHLQSFLEERSSPKKPCWWSSTKFLRSGSILILASRYQCYWDLNWEEKTNHTKFLRKCSLSGLYEWG